MANNLFAKYLWEISTIEWAGRITLRSLSEKWQRCHLGFNEELPRRTFDNHRAKIKELFNISIKCDKRTNEYYIAESDELWNGGIRKWLISNFEVSMSLTEARGLRDRILLEDVPSGELFLTDIIRAMNENKVVKVLHQSYWDNEPHMYLIKPYFIKLFKQRWYLIGCSVQKDEEEGYLSRVRTFGIDRFDELMITDESFTYPIDFDPDEYFYNSVEVIHSDDKPQRILIKVSGNQQKYIRSVKLHHSQMEIEKTDEFSIFELRLCPTFDFYQTILGYGEFVEILEPEGIRLQLGRRLNSAATKYKK